MADKPDEAQAMVVTSSPGDPLPVKLTEFSITLEVGASVEVNGRDWMKTSAVGGAKWNSLPSPETIKAAVSYTQGTLLGPVIEESLMQIQAALEKRQSQ